MTDRRKTIVSAAVWLLFVVPIVLVVALLWLAVLATPDGYKWS